MVVSPDQQRFVWTAKMAVFSSFSLLVQMVQMVQREYLREISPGQAADLTSSNLMSNYRWQKTSPIAV
jgi:hypothetical protein